MNPVSMNTEASMLLILAYVESAEGAESIRRSLDVTLSEAERYLSREDGRNALTTLAEISKELKRDAWDLSWRREWLIRSDAETVWKLESSSEPERPFPKHSLAWLKKQLENSQEMSVLELKPIFAELAVRSLNSPEMASEILLGIPVEDLKDIFAKFEYYLERRLYLDPSEQKAALEAFHPLAMLVANTSYSENGMPKELKNLLLPKRSGDHRQNYEYRLNIRWLGMLLGSAVFAPGFLTEALIYLLNRKNHEITGAATHLHPLKKDGGAEQPYAFMLSTAGAAHRQLTNTPGGHLYLLNNLHLSNLRMDIDTYHYTGLDPSPAFADLMLQLKINPPEGSGEVVDAFHRIHRFIYQNEHVLGSDERIWSYLADFVNQHLQEMRTLSTQITAPILAPITKNEDAMLVLSGGIGMFALSHLRESIAAEVNEDLPDRERRLLVSSGVDAVSDIYHHVFAGMVLADSNTEEGITILTSGLGFVSRTMGNVLASNLSLGTKVGIAGGRFVSDNIRKHIFSEAKEVRERNKNLTPRELFAQQIINRDTPAVPGGRYPAVTWFERELADQLLIQKPELGKDLPRGKWFDGETLTFPSDRASNAQKDDFAGWFSRATNPASPTDFSKNFAHLQREFGRDLLLDALSFEVDLISKDVKGIKERLDSHEERLDRLIYGG